MSDIRETFYNGWAKDKIFLDPIVTKREDSVTVEVIYNNKQYRYTAYNEDMFGNTNTYNYAFNRLLSYLKEDNKNIELKYNLDYV